MKLFISFVTESEADKLTLESLYDTALRDRHYRSMDDISGMYYSILDDKRDYLRVKFMRIMNLENNEVETLEISDGLNVYGVCIDKNDILDDGSVYVDALGYSKSFNPEDYRIEYNLPAFEFNGEFIRIKNPVDDSKMDDESIIYSFRLLNNDYELHIENINGSFKLVKELSKKDSDFNILHSFDLDLNEEDVSKFIGLINKL
jgi:hypothetical protein